MAKVLNKLTPLTLKSIIKNVKEVGKANKEADGGGLYFIAEPNRSSWWRFDYRFNEKQKTLSVGTFPDISLAEARELRATLRNQVANGIDPSQQRKIEKICKNGGDSFEIIAREWWIHTKDKWTEGHANRTLTRLINDVFPFHGKNAINTITAAELLTTMRRIENRGAIETAHRTNHTCEAVFSYAIGTSRCDNNPAVAIKSVLKHAPPQKNFARLKDINDIGSLLKNIDCYKGTYIIQSALKLMPLTFTRPNELASLEWGHIDLKKAMWTIPAHIKKQKKADKENPNNVHFVPLSSQSLAILKDIHNLTGNGRYVFTSIRTSPGSKHERPITRESLLTAIRRMGYSKDEMTSHGFRGIASTQIREINKNKFSNDVIETQMSHKTGGKVQQAYDHAVYLPERIELMQWWADYLDTLKNN